MTLEMERLKCAIDDLKQETQRNSMEMDLLIRSIMALALEIKRHRDDITSVIKIVSKY